MPRPHAANGTPAFLPEVAESDASGTVADVYDEIRRAVGFVPGLFRSLAVVPPYLPLAWEQSAPTLADDRFLAAATALADRAGDAVRPPTSQYGRHILSRYASGRMLLLSAGLAAALRGTLDIPAVSVSPQPGAIEAEPVRLSTPERAAPTADDAALFADIRRTLGTPLVNTVWRTAAEEGVLASVWRDLKPQAEAARRAGTSLEVEAAAAAHESVRWHVGATPLALAQAGVEKREQEVEAILDTYRRTLAQVLALVASSR